ncbi:MAG: RluA family pseudouridine synthase [Lentisphaeria bacterium]|nr:RluA family pseudouridine synthase [Lentisphaeria bacterium]
MDFDRFKMRERYSHVRENEHGMLLLDYMTENFSRFDRDGWQEKIKNKRVFVNGSSADCSFVLKKHDRVSLWEDLTAEPSANLLFETVYEDGNLLVFDKPSDLCVHPTGPFYQHSLWFQAGRKYGELFFAGRLDRETSGLIIAARSGKIASALKIDRKEYLVMVHGKFENYVRASGFLLPDKNSTIAKKRRFSFQDAENSESADTELFPLKINSDGTSVVKAVLHSGRMHQIRATMFSLGYPVVGDKLYGLDESLYNKISTQSFSENDRKKLLLANQALHCSKLEFIHPLSGDKMSFESPAPWMTDTVGY